MDERLYRKNTDTLAILGWGVILFCVWSIVKTIAMYVTSADEVKSLLKEVTGLKHIDNSILIMLFAFFGTIVAVDVFMRIYVGLTARAVARGKKKGVGYIVVTYLLIIIYIVEIAVDIYMVFHPSESDESILTLVVNAFINISSLITLIELVIYSTKVRRSLRKAQYE